MVRPWLFDPTATSTSSWWCRANSSRSRWPFEIRPSRRPLPAGSRAPARHRRRGRSWRGSPTGAPCRRARARALDAAPHAANDVLRERDPDLLVVDELRMRTEILETRQGGLPRSAPGRARGRVRRQQACTPRAQFRPRPRQREVDVEDHRAQHDPRITRSTPSARLRPRPEPGFARREAHEPQPVPRSQRRGRRGNHGFPRPNRGAQIRTGDLSDPNGARYQAAPHPERAQGTGSAIARYRPIDCPRGRKGRDSRLRERAARGGALAGVRAAGIAGRRRRGGDAARLRRLELARALRGRRRTTEQTWCSSTTGSSGATSHS